MALADQAKRLQLNYGPMDDSPARIEALAHKYRDLTAQAGRTETEASRHQFAGLLMEEAEGLMRWREFDEAERKSGFYSDRRAWSEAGWAWLKASGIGAPRFRGDEAWRDYLDRKEPENQIRKAVREHQQ